MGNEKPFKILEDYLMETDAWLVTQEAIAERLGVKVGNLKQWSTTRKFSSKQTNAEIITFTFFKSKKIRRGFIRRLKNLNYDISDYEVENPTKDNFEELLREFLAENIKKKSGIPTTKDSHTDVFVYQKPKQYFPQTLYKINDNGENEIIFDFEENNYTKIKKLRHLLLEAPGGQGKSLFLAKLFESAAKSNDFEYVFLVDLPELAALTKKKTHPLADRSAYYLLSYLSTISNDFLRSVAQLTEDNKEGFPRTLLLLDGYNEVFSLSDFDSLQIIDEIAYISKEWPATIIMTSRPSTQKRRFLDDFHTCNITGTPKEKVKEITQENSTIPDEVLSLAEIPLYYNAFAELKGKHTIKTKYGLLFHMYQKRYKQSAKSFEGFISYFVFSPLVIKHMVDKNKNRLSIEEINSFSEEFDKMNLKKFISIAAAECDVTCPIVAFDINKVTSIFLNQGPFEPISKDTLKIHDELKDFLLAFCYTVMRKVFRDSLEDGQYIYARELDFKINLKDDAANLFKESLGINSGEDLYNLKDEYEELNNCKLTPQTILFGYTLFMLADNLSLGSSAVAPFHEILKNFTGRISRIVNQGNFDNCLKDNNYIVDEKETIKCRMLDILSKHCEFYRRISGEYIEGIKLTEIAEKIKPNYPPIAHQRAKLLFAIYENRQKSRTIVYDIESIGFSDYSQLYKDGVRLLQEGASENFSFCNILLAVLNSNPAPFLYDDTNISVEVDYVKAFNLYRSLLFADRHQKFVIKRIAYGVRNMVGLVIKGHVKCRPDFVYEDGDPGENSVILGNKNTLALDENTIKMSKHLLRYVDGVNTASLNYYRAIVAYYDRDLIAAKHLLDIEKDPYLKGIFLHYVFNEDVNLDSIYEEIRTKMIDPNNDTIEKTHPVYWYCDCKLLDLAFYKDRQAFFDEFEAGLPETLKRIINQITE